MPANRRWDLIWALKG